MTSFENNNWQTATVFCYVPGWIRAGVLQDPLTGTGSVEMQLFPSACI